MELVTIDGLGRILLPKALRRQLDLRPGDRLLAVPRNGRLLLAAVDVDALARQMHEELDGADLADLARTARAEADRDAATTIGRVLAGHEPRRGRDPKAPRRLAKPAPARRPR